jgi:hypothetical protein
MKRVLIISPRFPPKNAPDHHRVRTSLPYFRQNGWEPTVLCLTPETSDGVDDPDLALSLDPGIRVVRVAAWPEILCRRVGFGHLDYRCLWPLYRAGRRLLQDENFDVVFFSTTSFLSFVLGRIWKWEYKFKLVFDFQDPWINLTAGYTRQNAPGGWRKYRINQKIAGLAEPFALRAADHIISVSAGYVRNLTERYAWLPDKKFSVMPFGAAARDFELVKANHIKQKIFRKDDGLRHWVYVGRGGPDMDPALTVLFTLLARWKKERPDLSKELRLHFVGTNYSPADRTSKVVEPLAARFGLSDLVEEHSERIPYFQALALMLESDAVLLIGSFSADYTASKFFNCVMSEKPVMALFHQQSLVSKMAPEFPSVFPASFNNPEEPEFYEKVASGLSWLWSQPQNPGYSQSNLTSHTAESLTFELCGIFDRMLQ